MLNGERERKKSKEKEIEREREKKLRGKNVSSKDLLLKVINEDFCQINS